MRTIPDPGFPGDDGSADAALVEVLAGYEQDPDGGYLPMLAVLSGVRVLVPVVAVLGEMETNEHGLAEEKTSDMATVLMQRPDGRRALLAFTSTTTLAAWNPEGRPVPVPTSTAAASALQEGAEALLIDASGPVRFVVQGDDLAALARGWRLLRLEGGGWGWLQP